MEHKNKISAVKSQVSIFIVFSLVIVLFGMLYFFYQKQAIEQKIEIVPTEAVSIKLYVDNCIKQVAEDGLEKIGLSGGYINIPERIKNDPRAYLTTFPVAGFKIPYWWHEGIHAVPTEEFVRQELIQHIQIEIRNCINNFESFAGAG